MKAVVQERYGPPEVLRLVDVERPEPAAGEVLVRVHASSVNRTDAEFRRAKMFLIRLATGIRRPRHPRVGREFAGVVEAIGAGVTELAVGDRVFGLRRGANAEYVCVRAHGPIVRKPERISFEQAAGVADGAVQALAALRRAGVGPGTRILVYGASGSCGTAAVQLAKHLGAHVTAVCGAPNVELVRSLGADAVIDYLREDFTRNGERYDVVLDAVGKHSFFRSRRSLTPTGVFLATDRLHNVLLWAVTGRFGGRKVAFAIPRDVRDDVRLLARLIEAGAYRPVIDRSYPLDHVVEAHRYVDTGQKVGNVILLVDGGSA